MTIVTLVLFFTDKTKEKDLIKYKIHLYSFEISLAISVSVILLMMYRYFFNKIEKLDYLILLHAITFSFPLLLNQYEDVEKITEITELVLEI